MGRAIRWRWAAVSLAGLALLAALALTAFGGGSGRPHARPAPVRKVARVRPAIVPPTVAPLAFIALAPEDARAANAALPIDPALLRPAGIFTFVGEARDRANAVTCLAAAALYEAGDDKIGEEAVVQVVLNRLRHPAFPKSVCGVVFQGADLPTGCQFTFTCDGALARVPVAAAWERARAIAERALAGYVDKAVGTATHYHADYVVPYWRDSLDKIAVVHSHIFYRWRGWWGTVPAFSGTYQPPESLDVRLASLAGAQPAPALAVAAEALAVTPPSPTPAPALPLSATLIAEGVTPADLHGNTIRAMDARLGRYMLLLDSAAYPGSYAVTAFALCKVRPVCEVTGWTDAALLPAGLPDTPASRHGMAFRYRKDGTTGFGEAKWDCRQIHRDDPAQCLTGSEVAAR